MDDTGPVLPTEQPTPEPIRMEDVGYQLTNVEHIQQSIQQQLQSLRNNGDEKASSELEAILPNLAGLQLSLRRTFDAHVRRLLRNCHILDLPDELLMKIFEDVKHSAWDAWLDCPTPSAGSKHIQNIRLTCMRFCNASSHLLLDLLDVSITFSSLNHLYEVSRHPTISKGIRKLRIHAALYSPIPAESLRAFINQAIGPLHRDYRKDVDHMRLELSNFSVLLNSWDPVRNLPACHQKLPEFCSHVDSLERRNEILLSCANYLRDEESEWNEDADMETLRQIFEEYSQLCTDQHELLQQDAFAESVAEAAARLPKSIELIITDTAGSVFRPLSGESQLPIYASVREMLQPSPWTSEIVSLLSQHPSRLLYQLPHAFYQAGNPLTGLRICLGAITEQEVSLSKVQAEDLVSATRNLKVLEIDCYLTMRASQSKTSLAAPLDSPHFASLFLNGTNLRSVTLYFSCATRTEDSNAKSLLALLPWASLERVQLIGACIHGHELSELLEKLSPGTYIYLECVHLLTGLWADLLDVLRTKADCNSCVEEPSGNGDEELYRTFTSWAAPNVSSAVAYIRGEISENPLRSRATQEDDGIEWPSPAAWYQDI